MICLARKRRKSAFLQAGCFHKIGALRRLSNFGKVRFEFSADYDNFGILRGGNFLHNLNIFVRLRGNRLLINIRNVQSRFHRKQEHIFYGKFFVIS